MFPKSTLLRESNISPLKLRSSTTQKLSLLPQEHMFREGLSPLVLLPVELNMLQEEHNIFQEELFHQQPMSLEELFQEE